MAIASTHPRGPTVRGTFRARALSMALSMAIATGVRPAASPGEPTFLPPLRLSRGEGAARQPDIEAMESATLVAFVDGEAVRLRSPGDDQTVTVVTGIPPVAAPRMSVDSQGRLAILSSALAGDGSAGGRLGLWLSERDGGAFAAPSEVASGFDAVPDHGLAYGANGSLSLTWVEPIPGVEPFAEGPQIVLSRGVSRLVVAQGTCPLLALGTQGFTHLVYLRGSRAFYRTDRLEPDFSPEVELTGLTDVSAIAMALDQDGRVQVILEASSGLHIVAISGGAASAPRLVAAGGLLPRLASGPRGSLVATFLLDGALRLLRRQPGAEEFDGPWPVPGSGQYGTVRDHDVALDAEDSAHLTFEVGDEVYYTNDIPPPEPRFSASPLDVSVGAEVAFEDLSTGRVSTRVWAFGDGTQSTEARPRHRYLEAGRYRPSLTLTGPGGTRSSSLPDEITVRPPDNELRIPSVEAFAGEKGIALPVYLTSSVACKGYQVVVQGAPELVLKRGETDGTWSKAMGAEFLQSDVEEDPLGPVLTIAALWDYFPPLDGRVLPPGADLPLLLIEVDVSESAAAGAKAPLKLLTDYGPDEKSCLLVSEDGSHSIYPFLRDGEVAVTTPGGEPDLFVRGNSNGDQAVDISDVIAVLNHLFVGGPAPVCTDGADANDDGTIDISDPIAVLEVLFLARAKLLPYPFPAEGLDPTEDDLACR